MLSRRMIIGTAVTLVLLGVAGYAYLNPAFASACKSAYDTSTAWARQQADTAGQAFKRMEFYASVTKEMRGLDVRIATRKKAADAIKITQQRTAAASKTPRSDPSFVAVRQPEQVGGSPGQRIAHGHAFAKHGNEFGFTTENQMAAQIDQVVGHSRSSDVRQLSHGRTAYWDGQTRSVVIVDPNTHDGGTTFKPNRGRSYFESLK